MSQDVPGTGTAARKIDLRTDVPHSARIYDHLLGGKDNFAADRAAAAEIVRHQPTLPVSMRANRAFMARMARRLVTEHGVRQFLDIGTGLPTAPNLHEAAQAAAPETRVVYVDNDPIVLVHARALLTGSAEGRTSYLDADLRRPETILDSPELRATLDLSAPVALTMIAILQFFTDEEEAHRLVRALLEPLAPGSLLALSLVPAAAETAASVDDVAAAYRSQGIPMKPRTRAEVAAFFDGLELLEPGIVRSVHWRPDGPVDPDDTNHMYVGVARKP
ncbi:SAM-dependent methyltransferase [Actinomadura parmotrematis]|uniref:SAM-dependent methyltransferase n=1 Tax=Actinomadura parmotrematis TaxID=2864039 RepID=A0ABS7G3T1_9ACTN|nr:SAM-dependent methyltransferase [Actinomadura parmotrematis]MBW8487372.1 SAM-dependent methyltransferase [Actinomadura parmotrematis]